MSSPPREGGASSASGRASAAAGGSIGGGPLRQREHPRHPAGVGQGRGSSTHAASTADSRTPRGVEPTSHATGGPRTRTAASSPAGPCYADKTEDAAPTASTCLRDARRCSQTREFATCTAQPERSAPRRPGRPAVRGAPASAARNASLGRTTTAPEPRPRCRAPITPGARQGGDVVHKERVTGIVAGSCHCRRHDDHGRDCLPRDPGVQRAL